MIAIQISVKMEQHVSMKSINTRVFVKKDTLVTTVRLVMMFELYSHHGNAGDLKNIKFYLVAQRYQCSTQSTEK